MGDALCLLNPIVWAEPFGLVMLESLATGTPVVATPLGAAPEIIDDGVTGFLRDGPRELLAALLHVGDLDRRACRTAVERRFTADQMARRYLAVFERVAARWPAPHPVEPNHGRARCQAGGGAAPQSAILEAAS